MSTMNFSPAILSHLNLMLMKLAYPEECPSCKQPFRNDESLVIQMTIPAQSHDGNLSALTGEVDAWCGDCGEEIILQQEEETGGEEASK